MGVFEKINQAIAKREAVQKQISDAYKIFKTPEFQSLVNQLVEERNGIDKELKSLYLQRAATELPTERDLRFGGGSTRWVMMIGPVVLKIPNMRSWRHFLNGLIANMKEATVWDKSVYRDRMAPMLFWIPGGWLNVMRRVDHLKPEHEPIDPEMFRGLPLDLNARNYGYLAGRLVMLDYGGPS